MTTTLSHGSHHSHPGPTHALRRLGRALKSRTTTVERVEDARSMRVQVEQAQFVRSFRM